jgi:hypothetical protein
VLGLAKMLKFNPSPTAGRVTLDLVFTGQSVRNSSAFPLQLKKHNFSSITPNYSVRFC